MHGPVPCKLRSRATLVTLRKRVPPISRVAVRGLAQKRQGGKDEDGAAPAGPTTRRVPMDYVNLGKTGLKV
ncbi:MAG: hypothetical protein QOJ16_1312, partial [Acidobacteriota bacterium]|nr:hypothetical protein [Acidobacteriota bacterium]